MKTFQRASLPEEIKYNGSIYTKDFSLDTHLSKYPEQLRIALESTGKKVILVKVLARQLKGKLDIHNKPYEPSSFLYTTKPVVEKYEGVIDVPVNCGQFSESQLSRLKIFVEQYSKEEVKVEQIGSAVYIFGSELACLRIADKYGAAPNYKKGYSENLKTFYFRIETTSPAEA